MLTDCPTLEFFGKQLGGKVACRVLVMLKTASLALISEMVAVINI